MKTLIIYDHEGHIVYQASGAVPEPKGIPFLWVDIPKGQRMKYNNGIGVDVSVTPNVAILEDIPKTEEDVMQEGLTRLGQTFAEEKLKNMQKTTALNQMGQELAKIKLDMMQLKGGK